MKIFLVGANGNLGQELLAAFRAAGHEVVPSDRKDLDITDRDAVCTKVKAVAPDVIVNAAAYNFVDKVEEEDIYPIAYGINALGPKHLAEAAKAVGAQIMHYSTDFVFAGEKPEGYTEDDVPQPLSKYGETKAAGEEFVLASGATAYVCRLSKIFGPPGISEASKPSFVSLMLRLAKEKPELRIVHEEVGTPTYTRDIAKTSVWMLENDVAAGVYHIVNDGPAITMYEYAEEVFSLVDVATPRIPVPSSEFSRPAKVPKFAALLNTKLPKLRSRRDAISEYVNEFLK